ncbi:unnamed protein product [Didymodactylos carnosus]|uniref:Uncharacterized protein n=1 Tax=Didymodactylos carnosus TaxID=1234261 RepID=A0A815BWJ5_9BILA|nr:unnamed protein product [Didymodactylos carnosus]CAF4072760.1 unnamed protein product [Didymodactylos carnosus]
MRIITVAMFILMISLTVLSLPTGERDTLSSLAKPCTVACGLYCQWGYAGCCHCKPNPFGNLLNLEGLTFPKDQ